MSSIPLSLECSNSDFQKQAYGLLSHADAKLYENKNKNLKMLSSSKMSNLTYLKNSNSSTRKISSNNEGLNIHEKQQQDNEKRRVASDI